jgi:uncharacterized RDD family membrane protein YckC
MSTYGNPPDPYPQSGSEPYGQPTQPAQDPYAQQQNPYGGGQPSFSGVPQGVSFAHWGRRVGAYFIDVLAGFVAYVPMVIALIIAGAGSETDPITGQTTMSDASAGLVIILFLLSGVLALAYFIWNFCLKQGRTGYTIGKGVMGIKLVKAETGQPVGAGMAFVRQIAHVLDSIPCNIGYLWPLWDAQRQTFADKVIGTYVIDMPKG